MANGDDSKAEGLYRFAHAEFDARAHELRIDGRAVPLEAKARQLLLHLLTRPGETLTKEELLAAIWPGRIVTDASLSKAVMKLRSCLGDEGQRIVRTAHGFGYRLGVPVEQVSSDAPEHFVPTPGAMVPFRANWRLVRALDPEFRGLVWQAEQVKTRDRRVFKFATDTHNLAALKREITLFRLLHDSLGDDAPVVRILDWNLDEPPYFTEAEWVDGGDLTAWIAGQANLAERIEAVAQVCEAVAATHALGVVHKDLKPANILLRSEGGGRFRVCLADFGIGALSDRRMIDALGITRLGFTGTRLDGGSSSGTPRYLAPEVVAGQVPTQKSDIYALGVILYQALVGDPKRPLAPGWERDIKDPLLREDIAAAADVDPERRLGDAGELARRLRGLARRRAQRLAAEQAEQARQTAIERAEVQARRNRLFAGLTAVLLIASVVSLGFYREARQAQFQAEAALALAEREAAISVAINRFLNEDLIRGADPYAVPDPNRAISTVIEDALVRVEPQLGGEPAVAGEVLLSLGQALSGLGRLEVAELALDSAIDQLQQAHGPVDARTLRARMARAMVENAAQRNDRFAEMMDSLMADSAQLPPLDPTRLRVVDAHAWAPFSQGRFEEARRRYAEALARLAAEPGAPGEELSRLYSGQALALLRLGQPEPALASAESGLALRREALGDEDVFTWLAEAQVANALIALDRADEALPRLDSVYRRMQARFGAVHNQSVGAAHKYGLALLSAGRPAEAIEPLEDAVRGKAELFGELSGSAVTSGGVLAAALTQAGRYEDAEALFRRYQSYQPQSAYDRRTYASLLRNRAELQLLRGEAEAARDDCNEALDITRSLVSAGHPMWRASEVCLGLALAHLGEREQARALIDANLEALRQAGRPAAHLVARIEAAAPLLAP